MVDERYKMILEHSRSCFDSTTAHADVRALQPRFKESIRKPTDGKGYSSENTCFNCGSKDHWVKGCPKKPSQPLGAYGQSSSSGSKDRFDKSLPTHQK